MKTKGQILTELMAAVDWHRYECLYWTRNNELDVDVKAVRAMLAVFSILAIEIYNEAKDLDTAMIMESER